MLVDNISQAITNPAKTSVSPLATSAFPMDARTYFESYEDAVSVAALAEQQGSKNTIYYFGMSLVVYENDEVQEYIIVKDKDTGKGILKEKIIQDSISAFIIDGGNAEQAEAEYKALNNIE